MNSITLEVVNVLNKNKPSKMLAMSTPQLMVDNIIQNYSKVNVMGCRTLMAGRKWF